MDDSSAKVKGGTSAKGGVNIMEGHRKRQSQGVSLRDKARKKNMEEHRGKGTFSSTAFTQQLPANQGDPTQYADNIDPEVIPLEIIPVCAEALRSHSDMAVKAKCCKLMATMLRRNKPTMVFDDILQQDIGFTLSRCCKSDVPEALMKEAICLLSLLTTGTDVCTQYVIASGGVSCFGVHVAHRDVEVRISAMSGLASLITDAETRDLMSPFTAAILDRLCTEEDTQALGQCVYFFTQFSKVKQYLSTEFYAPVIPRLTQLISHPDQKIFIEAAWALSYISDGDKRMPAVASRELIFRCAELLRLDSVSVKVPALRLIGNFCSGDDAIAECVLETKCFDEIPALLSHVNVKVRKEANWMISNIAAGPPEQVRWLLGTGYLPLCTPALSAEFTVRKEAIWVFKNIADIAEPEQLWYLINDCKFLEPFVNILDIHDKRLVLPLLDSLSYLIHHGAKIAETQGTDNPITTMFQQLNVAQKLGSLMTHADAKVSREATDVYYLLEEEEDDDEDYTNNNSYANQFFNQQNNGNDGWEEDTAGAQNNQNQNGGDGGGGGNGW